MKINMDRQSILSIPVYPCLSLSIHCLSFGGPLGPLVAPTHCPPGHFLPESGKKHQCPSHPPAGGKNCRIQLEKACLLQATTALGQSVPDADRKMCNKLCLIQARSFMKSFEA